MSRPRLLDLFCGAGGCAVGYHRAGFDVVGVDNRPQKNYPFPFVRADALEYAAAHGREFDAIHASPPCQAYSMAAFARPNRGIVKNGTLAGKHDDLLPPTRDILVMSGKPWVIENVVGAPFEYRSILCGLMFGLRLFRHRGFESSFLLLTPPHPSHAGKRVGVEGFVTMVGDGDSLRKREPGKKIAADHKSKAAWNRASGIDWMTKDEMAQAIPPAYTEFVGRQLLAVVNGA